MLSVLENRSLIHQFPAEAILQFVGTGAFLLLLLSWGAVTTTFIVLSRVGRRGDKARSQLAAGASVKEFGSLVMNFGGLLVLAGFLTDSHMLIAGIGLWSVGGVVASRDAI